MQFHPDLYSKSVSSEELILRGLGKVNDIEVIHFDFITTEKKYSEELKEILLRIISNMYIKYIAMKVKSKIYN